MDNIPTDVYRDVEQIVKDHLTDMHEAVIEEFDKNGYFNSEEAIKLTRNLICENL